MGFRCMEVIAPSPVNFVDAGSCALLPAFRLWPEHGVLPLVIYCHISGVCPLASCCAVRGLVDAGPSGSAGFEHGCFPLDVLDKQQAMQSVYNPFLGVLSQRLSGSTVGSAT